MRPKNWPNIWTSSVSLALTRQGVGMRHALLWVKFLKLLWQQNGGLTYQMSYVLSISSQKLSIFNICYFVASENNIKVQWIHQPGYQVQAHCVNTTQVAVHGINYIDTSVTFNPFVWLQHLWMCCFSLETNSRMGQVYHVLRSENIHLGITIVQSLGKYFHSKLN
jgi:hypothetical protein